MKIKEIYRFAISKKWICRQRLFFEYIDKGILIKFTEIRVEHNRKNNKRTWK